MHRLFGLALLGSTALWPVTAIAQKADADASLPTLSWQEMNDCQKLAVIAEIRPDAAPMSGADARSFATQNDLASCTQAIGEVEPSLSAELQQEYEADFAQQQQAADGDAPAAGAGEAAVIVQLAAPEVTVQQPEVTVRQEPPQIIVRQQAPTITIQQPAPEIIVRMPELDVSVNVEQPQVSMPAGEPMVDLGEQAQPQVTYEEIGEPEIVFERAEGEPQITIEKLSAAEAGTSGGEAADEVAASEEGEVSADQPREVASEASGATQADQGAATLSEPTEVATSDIIGREVVNEEGQRVGEVQAVAELQAGGFAAVVVADEFLGIGERQYAIPFDNLALAKDALVVIDLNAEALAQSPEWDQSFAARDLAPEDMTQMRVWEMPEGEGSQQ